LVPPPKYIAKKLLEINERGTWIDPGAPEISGNTERLMHQDEEIFQITRLINATWFASIVFSDYFSSILGLVREGNPWILNVFGVSNVM
jgi:linoleate 10R-lipoxygenase